MSIIPTLKKSWGLTLRSALLAAFLHPINYSSLHRRELKARLMITLNPRGMQRSTYRNLKMVMSVRHCRRWLTTLNMIRRLCEYFFHHPSIVLHTLYMLVLYTSSSSYRPRSIAVYTDENQVEKRAGKQVCTEWHYIVGECLEILRVDRRGL